MTKTLTELWNPKPLIVAIRPTIIFHCYEYTAKVLEQRVNKGYKVEYKRRMKYDDRCDYYDLRMSSGYYISVRGNDWTVYTQVD